MGSTKSEEGSNNSLYNRFVEVMIVIGIDENTGLIPIDKKVERDSDSMLLNMFHQEYEPHVLAAISATKATYFQPVMREDPNYPSVSGTDSSNSLDVSGEHSGYSRPRTSSFKDQRSVGNGINKSKSMKLPAFKRRFFRKANAVSSYIITVPDLPLSEEVIRSVPVFCFPEYAKVYREKPESSIHFLVFTDITGNRSYATCLTFYKPYILEKQGDHVLSLSLEVKQTELTYYQTRTFLPQCCVLISKYPYFYSMKECLSCMVECIERDVEEMFSVIKDFTYLLTFTPVPPPGTVNIVVTLPVFQRQIVLYPSNWAKKPVIDIPLYLVFQAFSVEDILRIFTCVLTERRLVFVSSSFSLLTVFMESFLSFILPFSWQFTYVPVLSISSLELLEAPGTFMIGCHIRHLEDVERVEGVVIVNIDEGCVEVIPELSLSDNSLTEEKIPPVPSEPAKIFTKKVEGLCYKTDLNEVQRPVCFNIEEERTYRRKRMQRLNEEITHAFLELMVNLFRGVIPELKIELYKFKQDAFIRTIDEECIPFYESVLMTDMFKKFLTERVEDKFDYWSDFETKTRTMVKKKGGLEGSTSLPTRKKSIRKQVSVSIYQSADSDKKYETFRLPILMDVGLPSFLGGSVIYLTKIVKEAHDMEVQTSCLYLRAMLQAAQGRLHDAMDDFQRLHSTDARLVPLQYVRELYNKLPEEERGNFSKKQGTFHLIELLEEADHDFDMTWHKKIWYHDEPLPEKDLALDEFVNTISLLEIANNYSMIEKLFNTLGDFESPVAVVDQKTFKNFVECYRTNQGQCDNLKIENNKLHQDEIVLKVSNLINTSFDNGRIALTDKRLFFLKGGSNSFRDIIKLRDISNIEKKQGRADALVIHSKDGGIRFRASLKEDRNLWYMLIEEMRAGKLVAEATRDLTAKEQAVVNVFLIDAAIRSGNLPEICVELCYFTEYTAQDRHILPQDTVEALQHRVDPNHGDRDRKTVKALLYTPGSEDLHQSGNLPPRLWCGMGDGKVKVFDATTWELERKSVQTKTTLACLVAVGDNEVWVGSHGIFIINRETITCNKTLAGDDDLITDIVISDTGQVYSASVGGIIIIWDIKKLAQVRKIKLKDIGSLRSLKVLDNQLWCGTWKSLIVYNFDQQPTKVFQVQTGSDHDRMTELDCFEVTDTEVWAGCRRHGLLVVWDRETTELKAQLDIKCRGVSTLLLCDGRVWVGTKDGTICIYLTDTHEMWKMLQAHDDAVRSLCPADVRYIISGAGSKDGKVAIWTPRVLEISGTFLDD